MTLHHAEADIIIAGGGIVGITAALALAATARSVVLVDALAMDDMTLPAFDGRVTSVAYGSHVLLANLGVWPDVASQAEPILDIRVADGGHSAFLHFDHRDLAANGGNTTHRPFGFMVENRYLRLGLLAKLRQVPGLQVLAPAQISGYAAGEGQVTVSLADGRQLRAQLLIAADGKNSSLRRQAGIRTVGWSYRQHALVATFAHDAPHYGVAKEHFMRSGPFALLPMTERRSSLVWTEQEKRAKAYAALSDDAFTAAVADRAGGHLGTMRLAGPRFQYPLSLTHAERYIDTRMVLIGDAAHAMHPLAGQGLNLAWRDVAVLSEVLEDCRALGMDIGSQAVLQRYHRRRHWDSFTMLLMTDGLNRLFSTDFAPLRVGRRLGLSLVNRLPRTKRYFERHASALSGDLPRLMQEAAG